jgi:hypothetical protein
VLLAALWVDFGRWLVAAVEKRKGGMGRGWVSCDSNAERNLGNNLAFAVSIFFSTILQVLHTLVI